MSKASKIVFLIFFSLLIISSSLLIKTVKAADALPGGGRIPCDVNPPFNPEFNTDRPYQASPCGDPVKALFCGNTVIINLGGVSCPYNGGHTCQYTGPNPITKHIVVDLSDVNLPILGNTQNIKNSVTATPTIDEATRLNEYVSSYLNGTNFVAEYGNSDPAKLVDYSGPIKKLLPQAIQDAQRITSIEIQSTSYTPDPDGNTGPSPQSVTEPENHNQIVVCAKKQIELIPSWLTNIFGIGSVGLGKATPLECYKGSESQVEGSIYRLSSWQETPSQILMDLIRPYLDKFLPPSLITPLIKDLFVDRWGKNIPPVPWDFTDQQLYTKAYNEWRGDLCAFVPNLITHQKSLVCVDIPSVTNNEFADLFPYIPLANTADKKGAQTIDFVHTEAPRAELLTSDYIINKSPQLYLAHTTENRELSSLLQSTFKPIKGTNNDVPTETTQNNSSNDVSQCQSLNARSNPGDDATFSSPKSFLDVEVTYTVGEIQCTPPKVICPGPDHNTGSPRPCHTEADCSSDIYATIPSISKTPEVDDIWKDTTAGNDSIFRKIYPQVNADAPVSCIGDNPGVSKATYSINSDSTAGISIKGIQEPGGGGGNSNAGNKASDPVAANIYFPHLGSIYDYFLKGIQTALRPKGYADQVANGICGNTLACGDLKNLPKATGACNLGSVSSRIGEIPKSLKAIVSAAAQTYHVPPNLILGVLYGEGTFNKPPFQKYDWTEENVKNWATCTNLPHCSGPEGSLVPFISGTWPRLAKEIQPDLVKLDPNRKVPNPCNLLDATYAIAKDLHDNAGGSPALTGNKCYGITMSSTNPQSCDWATGTSDGGNSSYETAIRVWEFGTKYDSQATCATLAGSCASGGSFAAACPGGDNCEKNGQSSNTSHNACVFDVAHGK